MENEEFFEVVTQQLDAINKNIYRLNGSLIVQNKELTRIADALQRE